MGRERERERERERGRGVVPGVEVELGPDHNFLDTAVVETDLDHRAEVVGTLGEETEAIAGTAGAAAVDNKESDSLIIFDSFIIRIFQLVRSLEYFNIARRALTQYAGRGSWLRSQPKTSYKPSRPPPGTRQRVPMGYQ